MSYVRSSARSGVFGRLFGTSAHARTADMECSGVRPCRENGNYLKWVANKRYLPIYSTVTMNSNNPKILAPTPSQCTPYSQYFQSSEVFPNIPDPRYAKTATADTLSRVKAPITGILSEFCLCLIISVIF